ncbi:hypothetical protein [Alloactinosynnema sp. L-07]|nr:hypothetical protein [Alloactinosynnema sp. L-07]
MNGSDVNPGLLDARGFAQKSAATDCRRSTHPNGVITVDQCGGLYRALYLVPQWGHIPIWQLLHQVTLSN